MSKITLITGMTGQDGFYLEKFFLSKNYHMHAVIKRVTIEDEFPTSRF